MRCPDCGGCNPSHAKFCRACGHRTGAEEPRGEPGLQPPVAAGGFGRAAVFRWIAIGIAGLFVLGLMTGV